MESRLNAGTGKEIAEAIDRRIIDVAKQVWKGNPSCKWVQALVVEIKEYGYTIKINNVKYENVKSYIGNGLMAVNDVVDVLIPNNNWENMVILGKVAEKVTQGGTNTGEIAEMQEQIQANSDNIVSNSTNIATNTNNITTNATNLANHLGNTNNPHNVTKAQVGLGNVLNTKQITKVNGQAGNASGEVSITIPPAQVNSDWNATSGVAQILNKPAIPTLTYNSTTKTLTITV